MKTSLAPGSQVVTDYLDQGRPRRPISTPSASTWSATAAPPASATPARCAEAISECISDNDLVAVSVLSGNRNFEGRVNPDVRANYLASPPLVVAYALAGSMTMDITTEPLGEGKDGKPVYLKDIWPTSGRSPTSCARRSREMFPTRYADVFKGDSNWQGIKVEGGQTYAGTSARPMCRTRPISRA